MFAQGLTLAGLENQQRSALCLGQRKKHNFEDRY